MTEFPESGVKLIVDTSEALSAVSELQGVLNDLQSATYTATVSAEVDDSGLSDLPADGETIDVTADVTVEGDELPQDGETVDSTVNTTVEGADDNSTNILQTLVSIKRNQQFRMALDIAGTAVDFFKSIGQFSIQPMVDLDNELAHLKATTGQTIPDADKLINKIFYSDLGESITQVGELVGQAAQLKAPIDQAVTSALEFTKVFTDQNPEQVLNTLNQLVITGLEPNFQKAGDDLVTAFQNGANKGGDLLDTLNRNAIAIKDLGLSASDALSLVQSGLAAGFTSADEVIKTLEKIKQNVQGAAGTSNKTADTLHMLGIANPAETGKAWSAEFFASVIEGIQKAPVSDSQKMEMFQNLVGGKLSAKEFSSFMKLSPEDAAGIFENTKGAAAKAAADIDDSLGGAIKDFERAAQGAAVDFLSSKQIDLPGKITALKTGIQDGLTSLQTNGDLSQALTIALKPIGFDTAFQGLESMLGNFVIAILQAVSFLQSLDPANWKAKVGTDAIISQQGQKQLAFDLKIANPDQVASDITTAVSRGVSPEQISKSVGDAVNELIKNGQPAMATALVNAVKDAQVNANADLQLTSSGSPINVQPTVTPEDLAKFQDTIDQAQAKTANNNIVNAENDMTGVFTPVRQNIVDLKDITANANTHLKEVTTTTKDFGDKSTKAANAIGGASYTVTASADTATISLTNMSTAIDKINTAASNLQANASHVADVQGTLNDTHTPTGGHASGGSFVGTSIVGEQGREIVSSNMGLSVLNNMTTEKILAALQGYVPGAGGGGSSYVNNTINNVNVVPSSAVADTLGYRQAQTLRGMG